MCIQPLTHVAPIATLIVLTPTAHGSDPDAKTTLRFITALFLPVNCNNQFSSDDPTTSSAYALLIPLGAISLVANKIQRRSVQDRIFAQIDV